MAQVMRGVSMVVVFWSRTWEVDVELPGWLSQLVVLLSFMLSMLLRLALCLLAIISGLLLLLHVLSLCF
jgi:hypothetical protein